MIYRCNPWGGGHTDGFTIPKLNGIDRNVFQIVKQNAENICSG